MKQRIRALERKLAPQLAQVHAKKAVTEYIDEWDDAVDKNAETPDTLAFMVDLRRAFGYFRRTAFNAQEYLYDCVNERAVPEWLKLFRLVAPWTRL